MRRLAQAVLRRLDIDGVYLTAEQACLLEAAIWKYRSGRVLAVTTAEIETIQRFSKRVGELSA